MKRGLYSIIILLSTLSYALAGEQVTYGVKFDNYFDNREYLQMPDMKPYSGTEFAARIQPTLSLYFDEGNAITFGADMIQSLGAEKSSFFGQIVPLLYYSYESPRWSAAAGLFDRSRMRANSYSTLFFSDHYLFWDDVIGGVMGRYSVEKSFIEFVCDWEGAQSIDTREQFRLLSAGRFESHKLYAGYSFSLKHFAGEATGGEYHNVVDNLLLNPYVGANIESGDWEFDIHAGYIQSLQRDRTFGDGNWLTPMMGEVGLKVRWRGFSIEESLYLGDNVMPLYEGETLDDGSVIEYGEELYTGDPLFTTEGGFYNRASLKYEHRWSKDRVRLRVEFVTHATESGFGTEQILGLTVNLNGKLHKIVNR